VSAYGNWEEDRTSFGGSGGNNWVAGVQISVDILPIGKRAQLARESAAKQKIDAQLDATEQHLRLEVSHAHIHRQTAALQLETARAAMDQSAESLRAEDAERQSQSNYWHAVYGNAMAYSELLYATGTLTPDAAEELQ
jgi:outer membrane protein TolC